MNVQIEFVGFTGDPDKIAVVGGLKYMLERFAIQTLCGTPPDYIIMSFTKDGAKISVHGLSNEDLERKIPQHGVTRSPDTDEEPK